MADAQYVIDVATSFKGEQTIAQMDRLTAGLINAGTTADDFQAAVVQLSQSLETAKAASTAANDALAAGNAEYKLLERAAVQASKALERAGNSEKVSASELSTFQDKANLASQALQAHVTTLRSLENAAATATKKEADLGVALGNTKKLASSTLALQSKADADSDRNLKKLKAGLGGIGGPVGALGSSAAGAVDDFRDLEDALGSSGAKMAVAAGAASALVLVVAAVTAAVVVGTLAIAAWAVGLADSNRNMKLSQEALEAMHPELIDLRGTIGALSNETGAHADELSAWAGQLREAKVAAADMPDALRAVALSEAALGKGGSADFFKDIKEGKRSVSALATEANSKLGGIVSKQMTGLSAQSERASKNIANLFGGLNIDPVLLGLQKLVALFDENTAAGDAMKFLFESVFQPLINQATNAATVVEAFALGFLIGLTKVYIAVKPVMKAIGEFLGFKDASLTSTLEMVTKAGEYLVPAFLVAAGIFVALAAAVVIAVGAVVAIQVAIYSMVAAVVYAGVSIVSGLIDAWHAVTDYLDSISLAGVGTAIMQGLAAGLTGGASEVVAAVVAAAKGAITAAKSALGIHSPSKVFAEIGDFTAQGFAEGVDDAAPEAKTALERMVDPPSSPSGPARQAPSSRGAGAGGGAGLSLTGPFIFNGVKDAADAEARFEEMLTRVLEGDALQVAGGETP